MKLDPLPQIRRIAYVYLRAIHVLRSKGISDHWKEKVLPAYAVSILRGSIVLFFIIVVVMFPFLLAVVGTRTFTHMNFYSFITSFWGVLLSIIFGLIYSFVRVRHVRK